MKNEKRCNLPFDDLAAHVSVLGSNLPKQKRKKEGKSHCNELSTPNFGQQKGFELERALTQRNIKRLQNHIN